jgi:hypothetical protein
MANEALRAELLGVLGHEHKIMLCVTVYTYGQINSLQVVVVAGETSDCLI